MKKITFLLSLVSASLTVTAASAAVQNSNDNLVVLPAFTVTAARYTAAEKTIASNLAELRAKAQPAFAVRTELPSFNLVAQQPSAASNERSIAVAAPRHHQARS
ncbi:hypothetical protein [Oleiharenicola sp. Vm1]|uniref:hypothetical protein n=1 Tax=Oleiharenicola sp. Vm1 TaxID=3398393 RepID=UPI0039F61E33